MDKKKLGRVQYPEEIHQIRLQMTNLVVRMELISSDPRE